MDWEKSVAKRKVAFLYIALFLFLHCFHGKQIKQKNHHFLKILYKMEDVFRSVSLCRGKYDRLILVFFSPGLKSTTALRQANSVGSTARALKRLKTSCRRRRSRLVQPVLPCMPGQRSESESNGQLSSGRDHWTAQSRKSSLHASSSRITWWKHNKIKQTQRINNSTDEKLNFEEVIQ